MKPENESNTKSKLRQLSFRVTTLLLAMAEALLIVPYSKAQEKPEFRIPKGATELPRLLLPRDRYPDWFKVHSKNASETMHGICQPTEPAAKTVSELSCRIVQVRFIPPKKKSGLERLTEFDMTHPRVTKELQANPERYEQLWNNTWKKNATQHAKETCEASSKATYERKIRDPGIGPKRKQYLQDLLAACLNKDAPQVLNLTQEIERRTCTVSVSNFMLGFKKLSPDRWLNTKAGEDAVTVYELISSDGGRTLKLIKRTVPLGEKKENLGDETVWTDEEPEDYELPCDFISENVWPVWP